MGIDFVALRGPVFREMPKRPEPDKTDRKVTRSVAFPSDVYEAANTAAKADDRSLNSYVVRAVKAQLERDEEGRKKGR